MKRWPITHKNIRGLTLIEVLIALVIIGVAMLAIIKSTSDNIRSTTYLQNKTIALWVGQMVLNEARVNLIKLPLKPDSLKEKTNMLGRTWYWEAYQVETPNKSIRKISVSVFTKEDSDDPPLIYLESYVYTEAT